MSSPEPVPLPLMTAGQALDAATDNDVDVLLDVLADLLSRHPDDGHLARFHREAVAVAATDWRFTHLAGWFALFVERWLEVASPDDEARPLAEQMWAKIRREGATMLVPTDIHPVLDGDTIQVARSLQKLDRRRDALARGLRESSGWREATCTRGTSREFRPASRRKAASSRAGPSDDPDDLADSGSEPRQAGQFRMVPEKAGR